MQMKLLKIQYAYLLNFCWCRCMNLIWTALFSCQMISSSVFIPKCLQEEESAQQVGRKRAAPRGRGRGRGRGSTAKRGRKTDIASIQSMMDKDDDDSEDEPPKKAPPRVRGSPQC
jgi:hypothetical protein